MSERALKFVEGWARHHISADVYGGEDGNARSGQLAAACLDAAAKQGIAVAEIDEEFGSLEDYMAETIDRLAQEEFDRLRTQEPS